MKKRYFIFLSYNGANYHGWQLQPNNITVQEVLDSALSVVLNEKISTQGAGRTDAGVHAKVFCAHFDSQSIVFSNPDNNLIFRLNSFLPPDISIKNIRQVRPDANARYAAISRTYRYYISMNKDPFNKEFSWQLFGDIDINAMNEGCNLLFQHTDFTSFSKLHSGARTNICKIYSASWKEENQMFVFSIKADRFLRNMVRAIVGTMVEIGFKKITPDSLNYIILSKDRCNAGKSAPANGLFLEEIEYPEEIFV